MEQAWAIEAILRDFGIGSMPLPEGVQLIARRCEVAEEQLAILKGDHCDPSKDACGICIKCTADYMNKLAVELEKWKGALLDASIVDWVYRPSHETDPRKLLNDLLNSVQQQALDPVISKEAAAWVERNVVGTHLVDALKPYTEKEDEGDYRVTQRRLLDELSHYRAIDKGKFAWYSRLKARILRALSP
jgi:hypothetical protein